MTVALAHEYFSAHGGAERVIGSFHQMWPDAPVYTFFHDARRYGPLDATWRLRTSFLQQFPLGGGLHRALLPLYPRAARGLRVDAGTSLLLSSTSAFIKGVSLPDATVHVAYCHSPTRYLWDWSERYLDEEVPGPLRPVVRELLARLREDDRGFAARVDRWIANSRAVADRITRYYGAHSEVVYPPVDVERFSAAANARAASAPRTDYITVSRLVPYKRVDVLVEAFRGLPDRRLIVVGDGPDRSRLEALAVPNVSFIGRQDDAETARQVAAARAFVFAAEEDFGIAPVEAQAAGTPVIAYGRGGVRESIRGQDHARPTGRFFDTQEPWAVVDAVRTFEAANPPISAGACRDNALRFAPARFRDEMARIVDGTIAARARASAV